MLVQQYKSLIADEVKIYSILANTSAFIYQNFKNLNWAGFYLAEGEVLYLSSFQGKIACTQIPFSRGVCGKAAREQKTIVVDDVHEFKDHIACDSASNSEVVIPIIVNSKLYGVLDLDSPLKSNFKDKEIVLTLEKITTELANKIKELL